MPVHIGMRHLGCWRYICQRGTSARVVLPSDLRIVSDCLGALGRVVGLPTDRLPSGVKDSDILKILMVHCQSFSFECIYEHVEAHQDVEKGYHELPRKAQLNSCMDLDAKRELWSLSLYLLRQLW
jgi:hypothetical protein